MGRIGLARGLVALVLAGGCGARNLPAEDGGAGKTGAGGRVPPAPAAAVGPAGVGPAAASAARWSRWQRHRRLGRRRRWGVGLGWQQRRRWGIGLGWRQRHRRGIGHGWQRPRRLGWHGRRRWGCRARVAAAASAARRARAVASAARAAPVAAAGRRRSSGGCLSRAPRPCRPVSVCRATRATTSAAVETRPWAARPASRSREREQRHSLRPQRRAAGSQWSADFVPASGAILAPGLFDPAQRYPFQSDRPPACPSLATAAAATC